jgi:hypothetical protein
MGFEKRGFGSGKNGIRKMRFEKLDSENGIRKNGIWNRQKRDSKNRIRKTGFRKFT